MGSDPGGTGQPPLTERLRRGVTYSPHRTIDAILDAQRVMREAADHIERLEAAPGVRGEDHARWLMQMHDRMLADSQRRAAAGGHPRNLAEIHSDDLRTLREAAALLRSRPAPAIEEGVDEHFLEAMLEMGADICIDPSGEVALHEGGAFFTNDAWEPVDDGDGLRSATLGWVQPIAPEIAAKMTFRLARPLENSAENTERRTATLTGRLMDGTVWHHEYPVGGQHECAFDSCPARKP